MAGLRSIQWHDVGRRVYLPGWERTARQYAKYLKRVTVDQLPTFQVSSEGALRQAIYDITKFELDVTLSPLQQLAALDEVLGELLAAALAKNGWHINVVPGDELVICDDRTSQVLRPLSEPRRWRDRENASEAWAAWCRESNLAGIPLL
jgi:hypothetical protein